ncbi:MAG TPA: lipopolysaccharide kinase InaA family protein, partial [Sedimentisphaerales bacterium]|nr:lipopolysaccharide kinase InaA family protein [Sedimentisphaerales bacterium]
EKITNGEALERRLPGCFSDGSKSGLREKRAFLRRLGQWAARFHATGWRHRDFYLAHIFLTDSGQLYLIDLQRAFTPEYFAERYRRKDAAQLYYSMPRKDFSRTDRLRVYMAYAGTEVLCRRHRRFIAAVMKRVMNMARHDRRHGRVVPFEDEV